MVDYDKDFIFYDDSDDELVDVSNGIKTAEESANSKKGAKHSPSGAHHYAGVFSYEDENKHKKKKEKQSFSIFLLAESKRKRRCLYDK